MSSYQDYFILTLALIIPIFLLKSAKRLRKDNTTEYPPYIPISYIHILKTLSAGQLPQSMLKWARAYSRNVYSLRMAFNGARFIVVGDATIMRKLLTYESISKPWVYTRSTTVHDGGTNFFAENGERWYHARKSIMHAFSSHHIRRMRIVTLEKVENFMKKLDANERKSFDVGKEMINLTLEVICDAAFEYKMSESEQEEFLTELEIVLKENRNSYIPLRWRLGRFIPSVRRSRLGSKRLYALGEKILATYRTIENPIKDTVMDRVVNNPNYHNDKERVNDLLVLLLAGHDTTAYSLAWILKELAMHPQEQAKLRSELLNASVEERYNLKALHNVIKEGMRLNPVAALGGIRTSSKDIILEATGKYPYTVIPKGSMIFFSMMSILQNPLYFENPDDFIPSRWENPSDDAVAAFLPFLTGPRNCVGQSLANAEMRTVLSHLCANYEFTIENEGSNTFFLTYKPRNCLLVANRITTLQK